MSSLSELRHRVNLIKSEGELNAPQGQSMNAYNFYSDLLSELRSLRQQTRSTVGNRDTRKQLLDRIESLIQQYSDSQYLLGNTNAVRRNGASPYSSSSSHSSGRSTRKRSHSRSRSRSRSVNRPSIRNLQYQTDQLVHRYRTEIPPNNSDGAANHYHRILMAIYRLYDSAKQIRGENSRDKQELIKQLRSLIPNVQDDIVDWDPEHPFLKRSLSRSRSRSRSRSSNRTRKH